MMKVLLPIWHVTGHYWLKKRRITSTRYLRMYLILHINAAELSATTTSVFA